jgi:hypothetical protein
MPKFLIAIHRSNGYEPAVAEDDTIQEAIDEVNDQMVAAVVRIFVGGLHPVESVKSIRLVSPEQTEVSEGVYLECGEHVGGFWVVEVADEEAAIEWGKKASVACRASVEVRQFY